VSLDITTEEMDDLLDNIGQEVHSGNPVPMYLVSIHFTLNEGDIFLNEEDMVAMGFEASDTGTIKICFFEVEEKEEQLYFRETDYRNLGADERIQYKLDHLFNKMRMEREATTEWEENKAYG